MTKSNDNSRRGWFDRNFEWRKFIREQVTGRTTMAHRHEWDYLGYTGLIALVLVLIQMLSGLMLLLYYVPDPDQAFASYQMIRNEAPFGAVISNLHSINASLILLTLFIHMFRVMIISAHRGPREVQWYGGALLLLLMLITGFSGYLLPWSQQSFWACVIGTESVRAIPLVGDLLVRLLRGGEAVTGATLHRFFALHVSVLPVFIIVLVWIHLKRVWRTGVIAPPEMCAVADEDACTSCGKCERVCDFDAVHLVKGEGRALPSFNRDLCNGCRACERQCPAGCIGFASSRGRMPMEPVWPDNAIHRFKGVIIGLMILFVCVFFLPSLLMRIKEPANPMITPDAIKPEWYFLATYQALRGLPNELWGLLSIVAPSLLLFFLPALDKSGPRDPQRRPAYMFVVVGGIVAFVVLTLAGLY